MISSSNDFFAGQFVDLKKLNEESLSKFGCFNFTDAQVFESCEELYINEKIVHKY